MGAMMGGVQCKLVPATFNSVTFVCCKLSLSGCVENVCFEIDPVDGGNFVIESFVEL